jgi:hypothetical protein
MRERHQNSVLAELHELTQRAASGQIIGFGYTVITANRSVNAGLAGVLARDRLQAAGVLFGAAMRAAEEWEE